MTAPVCYLIRADRGARLVGLRVVTRQDEATWQSPASETPETASDARAAAEWLAERLSGFGRSIARLVLDSDGGLCSWVSATDTSEQVLRALIERPFEEDGSASGGRFPELPGETALEPLFPTDARGGKRGAGSEPSRVPVMAMPVVPARLLIDELDRLGIRVQIIEALWQSAAAAWDPSSSLGGSNSERVVAESLPTAASILFDPAGRLVWSWSRGGHLLAGGSMRILTERASEAAPDTIERGRTRLALVRGEDIARLGAEWLAWSLQLGVAPSRVVIVGEPSEGGLSAADLGRTISERWHDATIDFVREQDPVGATLARLADREPASQKGISELANRPGRAHKAMYRWTAAALFCGAGVLGVLAWRILASAGTFQDQAGTVSRSYAELCAEEGLALPTAIPDLDILIKQASKPAIDPSKVFPTVPVLQELEALSFVLGNDQLTLRELTINPISLTLKVEVAQTEMYEALSQSIRSVSGSTVEWRDTLNPRQTTVEATFSGSWPRSPGGQN